MLFIVCIATTSNSIGRLSSSRPPFVSASDTTFDLLLLRAEFRLQLRPAICCGRLRGGRARGRRRKRREILAPMRASSRRAARLGAIPRGARDKIRSEASRAAKLNSIYLRAAAVGRGRHPDQPGLWLGSNAGGSLLAQSVVAVVLLVDVVVVVILISSTQNGRPLIEASCCLLAPTTDQVAAAGQRAFEKCSSEHFPQIDILLLKPPNVSAGPMIDGNANGPCKSKRANHLLLARDLWPFELSAEGSDH